MWWPLISELASVAEAPSGAWLVESLGSLSVSPPAETSSDDEEIWRLSCMAVVEPFEDDDELDFSSSLPGPWATPEGVGEPMGDEVADEVYSAAAVVVVVAVDCCCWCFCCCLANSLRDSFSEADSRDE